MRQGKKADPRWISLTPEQKHMIDTAMAYEPSRLLLNRLQRDLRPLGPYVRNLLTEGQTRECFEELKRFLVTKALYPDKLFSPSSLIDDAWHTFIIFTKDYFDFCDLLGGYIHHRPLADGERIGVTRSWDVEKLVRDIFPDSQAYFWVSNSERDTRNSARSCCG